jgi:hypothetical protein
VLRLSQIKHKNKNSSCGEFLLKRWFFNMHNKKEVDLMDALRSVSQEANIPQPIYPRWGRIETKGCSGIQSGKNSDKDNANRYFDLFELIQEILKYLATYGEIPTTFSGNFRRKLERYISCIIKNPDPDTILRICNAFSEFVEKSIPKSSSLDMSRTSLPYELVIINNNTPCTENDTESTENSKIDLIESIEPCDNHTEKLQSEIKDYLHTFSVTISSDPINKFIENFFRNIMDNLDNLVKHAPLNEYCRNVFSQVEGHVRIWRKTLYDLYKKNFVLKKSKNTRIGDKAKKDIGDIRKLRDAVILIKKRIKNFRTNFQTLNSEKIIDRPIS